MGPIHTDPTPVPLHKDDKAEIERRAVQRGKDIAEMEQLREEHGLIMAFYRDYRTLLDKLYADKLTERLVRGAVAIVLIAVVSALVALVVVNNK